MECVIAECTKDKEIITVIDVLLEIIPLREAFPVLAKLLKIALTVVVSFDECKRSFLASNVPKYFFHYVRTTGG